MLCVFVDIKPGGGTTDKDFLDDFFYLITNLGLF